MKELTKAEEQVMQILWQIKRGFVKDILAKMPDPKPAYNTVSTIVRILEKKGFVSYQAYGKTHEYYPLVAKKDYSHFFLKSFIGSYFGGSFSRLVSFFAKENDMDIHDFERLMRYVGEDLGHTDDTDYADGNDLGHTESTDGESHTDSTDFTDGADADDKE